MRKEQAIVLKHHNHKIYQGSDGRWYTNLDDNTRKEKRKRIARKSYNDMIGFLYEIYREYDLTLQSLYPMWLDHKRLEAASDLYPERIDRDWKKYYKDDEIVSVPLTELEPLLLEEWVLRKIKTYNLTKTAYYNMTIILRQCLDYAVKKKYLPSNPFREVKIDTRRLLRRTEKREISIRFLLILK